MEPLNAARKVQLEFWSYWHYIPRSLLYAHIHTTRKIIQSCVVYPNNIASVIRESMSKRIGVEDAARTLEDYISDFVEEAGFA